METAPKRRTPVHTRFGQFRWLAEFIFNSASPKQAKWAGSLIILGLLSAMSVLIVNSGAFHFEAARIRRGEIDLSGTWKLWFQDKQEFASPRFNDADWCRISVPDAGVKPKILATDVPPSHVCPPHQYPVEQMRNASYWYRKNVVIPKGSKWNDPSLFVGAIKSRGWFYWDGQFIGIGTIQNAPTFFPLSQAAVRSGTHVLAVRVQSGNDQNPGIFHAYERKVAIGEFKESAKSVQVLIQQQFLEPFLVVVMQVFGLLLLGYLILRVAQVNENLIWMAIYFGAAGINSMTTIWGHDLKDIFTIRSLSLSGLGFALVGYGNSTLNKRSSQSHWNGNLIFITAVLAIFVQAILISEPRFYSLAVNLEKIVLIGSLVCLCLIQIPIALVRTKEADLTQNKSPKLAWITMFVLVTLHSAQVFERWIWGGHAKFFHLPLITSALTLLALLISVEEYIQRERQLAFFGRFIRSGLRSFLSSGLTDKKEQRLPTTFRGRKLPMMKIDIVGSTAICADMPYGARRLFQHLWYSFIDQVSEGLTIFDRPEGDGSIYYFDERNPNVSCRSVLELAAHIQHSVVPVFDAAYKTQLQAFLGQTSELQHPMEKYEARYQARFGRSFWEHQTEIRFAFTYGIVDEGLWGRQTQSHYDLSGNAIILLARLEKEAKAGEMVLSKDFYQEATKEDAALPLKGWVLSWQEKELVGLGRLEFARLKEEANLRAA